MTTLPQPLDRATLEDLKGIIESTDSNIVITCHVAPDGDAIGSSLALRRVLRNLGKRNVRIITPDMPPRSLSFLPGFRDIVVASRDESLHRQLLEKAKLIFCLDFNMLMRVDKMRDTLGSAPGRKIMIDHHLEPELFADITISHPEMSSTCYLLYLVLCQLGYGEKIDREAGEFICTGMITDTGNFTYNASDPAVYLVLSQLVASGVNKERLYKLLFDNNSETRLRLCSYAVYRKMILLREHHAAIIVLDDNELSEFGYAKGDTESLVNVPLSMPDIECSIFLRQDNSDFVKISARSKGRYPVNHLCSTYFGGGGHENAAGGEFYGSLDDAVDRLLSALPHYDKYLSKNFKNN